MPRGGDDADHRGVDFYGGSPCRGCTAFPPGWRDGAVLCALSQYAYWFLAVRSDIKCEPGDVSAVKGLRLSASVLRGLTLKRVLETAGKVEYDQVVATQFAPLWQG